MPSLTRRHQSNRPERLADIRERLRVAVEKLLAEGETYTEISVERMSLEAGITRTTFYVYFEDKADALLALLDPVRDDVERSARSWGDLHRTCTRQDVRRVLDRVLVSYEAHAAVLAAVYDTALLDESVNAALQAMASANIEQLRSHIEAGQADGWIDATLAPSETASWLWWMLQRTQQTMRTAGGAERTALLDTYADVFWNTLYRPAAAGPPELNPGSVAAPET